MSSPDLGASGRQAGRPALRRLVASDLDEFADTTWGTCPLLSRADELPGAFDDLFSPGAVDELVTRRGLRTPFLRVAKDGQTLGDRTFTAPGGVGAGIGDQLSDDRLTALFADGSTLVLQALHRTWPPMIEFVQQLASDLGHPVQANAYVTPPQSRGFDDHYDVHDVFVLQIEGEKRWRIHVPVIEAPLRDQPWTDRRAEVAAQAGGPPIIDEVLRPGDCLYLPRGFLHAATALGAVSTHITLGVHTFNGFHLAEEVTRLVLAQVADDAQVRRSLALGVDVGDPQDTAADLAVVLEAMTEAVAKVDTAAVADALDRRRRSSGRAAPIGPLAQLRATQRLDDEQIVVLRKHLFARLVSHDGQHRLESRAGSLSVAPRDLASVRALLESGHAQVADLGTDLARLLLRAAVVVTR